MMTGRDNDDDAGGEGNGSLGMMPAHKKLGLDRGKLSRAYTAERSGLIRLDHVTRRISADLFVCSQERPVPARVPAPG